MTAGSNADPTPIRKRLVGLIGAIGAGKSTVADELAQRGAAVIDADRVGYEVLKEPPIIERLVERFGREVLEPDGSISRRRLGRLVFQDPEQRRALEAIVHPLMRRRFAEAIRQWRLGPEPVLVLDAAILLEAGWDALCDTIVFVDAPRSDRLARLSASRQWTSDELDGREKAQMPLSAKRRRADVVIENAGSRHELSSQVDRIWKQWTTP